jgi:hypothetical protein
MAMRFIKTGEFRNIDLAGAAGLCIGDVGEPFQFGEKDRRSTHTGRGSVTAMRIWGPHPSDARDEDEAPGAIACSTMRTASPSIFSRGVPIGAEECRAPHTDRSPSLPSRQRPHTNDVFAAQLQQRSDTLIDLFAAPPLGMSHAVFHQQPGHPVLHLLHLLDQQPSIPQRPPAVSDLGRGHVALRQEVATKTVGDLAGIDPVVLPLGRSNRPQHQWVRHLNLLCVGNQVIVNPPDEDRCFQRDRPGLRASF